MSAKDRLQTEDGKQNSPLDMFRHLVI